MNDPIDINKAFQNFMNDVPPIPLANLDDSKNSKH